MNLSYGTYAHPSNLEGKRTKAIKYLIMHYTANNGDTAKGNCQYFSGPKRNGSANYFVDETECRMSVDPNINVAASVSGPYNARVLARDDNSISIEMCSRKDANGRYYIKAETVENAAQLAASLLKKYKLPVTAILRHYDVTGKTCPEPWVRDPAQFVAFKARVGKLLEEDDDMSPEQTKEMIQKEMQAQKPPVWDKLEDVPEWGRPTVEKLVKCGAIKGNQEGDLELNYDQLRVLVVNDKAGLYGK